MGKPSADGNAHALSWTTQPPQRVVVDCRPPAARGDYRADAGRHYSVARGQSAGGNKDRARSVSLLQPPRIFSAAVLYGADRGVVPVATADPPFGADRVRAQHGVDRGDAAARP